MIVDKIWYFTAINFVRFIKLTTFTSNKLRRILMKKHLLLVLLFVAAVSGLKAQTIIYSQGFASAPSDWTASASPVLNFLATPPTPPNTSPGGGGVAGKTAAGTTPAGGRFLTITSDINTSGFTAISVNWNAAAVTNQTGTVRLDYSTDGGATFPVGNQVTMADLGALNTWTAQTVNLPVSCENITNLRIRFAFISAGTTTRYYLDDITLTGTGAPTYFSRATGSLEDVNSWTDDPTGVAGTSPTDFTTASQFFILRNGNPGTIAGNWTISGGTSKLTIESGHTLFTDASNSFTGTVDVNNGATLDLVNATVPTIGTLGATSTVIFEASSAQTIPVASYGNLTIDNATHALGGSVSVVGTLTLNAAGILAIGDNNTLTVSGTLSGAGYINGSSSPDPSTNASFIYSSASSGNLNIGNDFHFKTFTVSNAVTLTLDDLLGAQLQINGALNWGNTNSRLDLNTYGLIIEGDITGAAGDLIGDPTSYIAIFNTFSSAALTQSLAFVTTTSLSSLEIFGRNVTLSTNLSLVDLLGIDGSSLTISGTRTITIQDLFQITGGGALVPGTSTFSFTGATNLTQTIPVADYNNISITGARTTNFVTLEAGTIGMTGNWTANATFTSGSYVTTGNTVDFSGASSQILKPTAARPCTFGSILISSGTLTDATVTGSVAEPGFRVEEDFTNNATFVPHATNPVVISGTGAQSIGGVTTTNFNNLTITSTGTRTVDFTAPVEMINDLSITGPAAGTLTIALGGNLTLKSTSTAATAAVSQITNPNNVSFTGNLNVERFAPGGNTGWTTMGSNGLTGQTFADWDDDMFITCAACPDGYNPGGSNFGSIQTYNEQVNAVFDDASRYAEIANTTDAMTNAVGYWVYFGDDVTTTSDIIIDQSGTIAKGDVSIPLTVTGGASADHGWNLIANPYPSAIDWDLLRNGNASVDNEIQVFNPDVNDYAVYSGGVGTNGLDNNGTIPMGQAFSVHASAATTLTAQESNKVGLRTDLLRTATSAQTVFRLNVDGLTYHDQTVFHFNTNATTAWDAEYDATNWYNMDPAAANISSVLNNQLYAINGLPELSGTTVIPVLVKVGTTGTYSVSPIDINNLPSGACVILHDNINNVDHDLRMGAYSVMISDSCTVPNFALTITLGNSLTLTTSSVQPTCANTATGVLTAVGNSSGPWNYYWKDANNTIVQTTLNTMDPDTLFNVGAGAYTVDVAIVGSCDNASQSFTITNPDAAQAMFTSVDTVYLTTGTASINFTDASSFATGYVWDFGDGSPTVTSQNPTHIYTAEGTYNVTLTAYNLGCADNSVFSQDVVVIEQSVVGIAKNELANNFLILQDENDASIKFDFAETKNVSVFVTDMLGRNLISPITLNANSQTVALGIGEFKNQVLFINIVSENERKVVKIIR